MTCLNKYLVAVSAALMLAACGDVDDVAPTHPMIPGPSLARVPSACDTKSLAANSRDYFSQPEQKLAGDAIRAMERACGDGNATEVVTLAWGVLRTVEAVVESGSGGAPASGATLANGLIAYMCGVEGGLCAPPPALVSSADFGPTGIFAVRGGDDSDAVAHGPVAFVDFDGVDNQALWGLETSASSWALATGVDLILFYGNAEVGTPLNPAEVSFGDLQFELNSFPDVDRFTGDVLHVGVCYESEVTLPHVGGNEQATPLGERMQREGTLLQEYAPGCAGWWGTLQTASLAGTLRGILAMAGRALLPQPLHAAFVSDRRAPSTGGTPIDFSRFAPVATNPSGRIVFVTPPGDGFAGAGLNVIEVQALSGGGTPMELVEVTLTIEGNQGDPAGATFCDPESPDPCPNPVELTLETPDGNNTVATFDGVTLWKPGGYTLCASGSLPGFTFEEACAVLHIKN